MVFPFLEWCDPSGFHNCFFRNYPPTPACKGERALRRTSMGKLYRNVWHWRSSSTGQKTGFWVRQAIGSGRNVWHWRSPQHRSKKRASWARLFWRVLVNVPEVFYVYTASTSLPQPALSYQNTMTNDFLMHSDATFDTGGGWNVVRKSRPGHAVSLFWRVLFQQLPQACHNQQYRTTTLWFFTGFRRDVRHGRGMKCGSKMLLVGRPGHAVSALLAVCLGVGLCVKSYKIVEKLVWSDQKQ